MNSWSLALIASVVGNVCGLGGAVAADLGGPHSRSEMADLASPANGYSWAGLWFGVQGGAAATNHDLAGLGLGSDGAQFGLATGYNFQSGRFVFGPIAEYNWLNSSVGKVAGFSLDNDGEWSVGGRLGYVVAPATMFYTVAEYTRLSSSISSPAAVPGLKNSVDWDGYTLGSGVEMRLTKSVLFGIEGRMTHFSGSDVLSAGPATLSSSPVEYGGMARIVYQLSSGNEGPLSLAAPLK